MRKIDFDSLNKPYNDRNGLFDRRFESAIGADIPSVGKLIEEIYRDFDEINFGIRWWASLPKAERILISDYLYQCVTGIEANLVEAKLHLMEWVDARERNNEKIANIIYWNKYGKLDVKMPPSQNAQDDLLDKLEGLHICGFFRAIGSSLDCLGAAIIGVLALPTSLRRSDIAKAERALNKVKLSENTGSQIQNDFKDLFKKAKKSVGPEDWLEWADQYRNMYVHRGRRTTSHQIIPRENQIYDSHGKLIPRAKATTYLAKYPDRSDAEAMIKEREIQLNEDAEITLNGIFKSVRELIETLCEQLMQIWEIRRNDPSLLEQPQIQWDVNIRPCRFIGYDQNPKQSNIDLMIVNPIFHRRMLAASLADKQRHFWDKSNWK